MKITLLSGLLALTSYGALASNFPVTVDSCGQPLTFTQPPQRAVIHDLNMTEMAFALGLQKDIVGLTGITGWYKAPPDFIQQQGTIPELAAKYPTLENLLAVHPDFFFAGWNYGMKVGGEVTPQSLKKYGIQTLVLSESCVFTEPQQQRPRASMDLLYGDMLKLGKIFGKQEQAQEQIDGWKQHLAELQTRIGNRPKQRVFLYDSGDDKPFTSGKFAMPTAIIEAAGGKNVMDDMETSWASTSWESVAAREPDFIILLDYQTGNGADALRRFLESHPLMKFTPAVQQQRYLKLQYAELTPGPANIKAIDKLAHTLYPDAFK
ncbi:ABC transporter substrate-binding protein [Pectobacterium zantedeschiae]|uniref:ABC transporter substrate-binding protein n=1 Tax=Pectobacterium zantedeschiae TaxID=2034769 RepID=UPI00101E075B|nr:ABC transporter substrate-binding protein [Pectobacterium zantedeschiae]RYC40347.1 ABC transporter substrate-binding protein [Pectobacterium zantedeschiae]